MDQLTAEHITDTLASKVARRRHQLAIYREAYRETYGRTLSMARLEAEDEILADLLEGVTA